MNPIHTEATIRVLANAFYGLPVNAGGKQWKRGGKAGLSCAWHACVRRGWCTRHQPPRLTLEGAEALAKYAHHYFKEREEKMPEHCAANRDGECYHKDCPQLRNWQSICPAPEWPEED